MSMRAVILFAGLIGPAAAVLAAGAGPTLIGPICPNQPAVLVVNATPNTPLFLIKNGAVVGSAESNSNYLSISIESPASFAQNDAVLVAEYINGGYLASNTVNAGCQNILTHHNDPQRTGWNPLENNLTPTNVNASSFGLVGSVPLDGASDAQPLVVANQTIQGSGLHSVVVYVATENNSVYAIDGVTGQVLTKVNLGPPVAPPSCGVSGTVVGINSTPVIDLTSNTLYVMAYVLIAGEPTYQLHAL